MNTASHRSKPRHWRRRLGYGSALLVILAGLIVAALSQFLPLLARHPQDVSRWLSERAGRPVEVRALDARWSSRGPEFDLRGLRIGADGQALLIDRAKLRLDLYAGWLPGSPMTALQINGLALTLSRDPQGRWQLRGLGQTGDKFGGLKQLEGLDELIIEQASLEIDDGAGKHWLLPRFDMRMHSIGGQLRLVAAAYVESGAPLRIVVELEPESTTGRVYLGLDDLDLARWAKGLSLSDVQIDSGQLTAEAWLDIEQGELRGGQLEIARWSLELAGGRLGPERGHPAIAVDPAAVAEKLTTGDEPGMLLLDSLPALSARLDRRQVGWAVAVETERGEWLRLEPESTGWLLQAGDLPLQQWAPLLALRPLDEPVVAEGSAADDDVGEDPIASLGVSGTLALLRARWRDEHLESLLARADNLSIVPVGKRPGFAGLSVDADWSEDRLQVQIVSPDFVLNWPSALREPLAAGLEGDLWLQREDELWRLDTEQLRVRGSNFAFDAAGGLIWDGDRPSMELQADVFEAPIVAAKRFWIKEVMPDNAIAWLDDGLIDGRLASGRLLLRGDLDDWPFTEDRGRMVAQANVEDLTLRYLPDWPIATELSGNVTFINKSFTTELSADVMGNRIERAVGGVAELAEPRLLLDIEGGGSGPQLLALLRNSALAEKHADTLRALEIGGSAEVDLHLDIPLVKRLGKFSMNGSAVLSDADLRDSRWGIALDAASGELTFSNSGLAVRDMPMLYSGQPARFNLAVGSDVADPEHALEATLNGRLMADTLLDLQPGLAWLKPMMSGSSQWEIGIEVPTEPGLSQLRLRSDLVGTRLSLPSPLSKSPAVQLPLDVRVALGAADQAGSGALDLQLGGLLRLYGNLGEEARFNGVASFGEVPDVELPDSGLRVVGQVPLLDATRWAAMAAGSRDGDSVVVDVDVYAGVLDLLDRSFTETRVKLQRPEPGALMLEFSGPVIEGKIDVPTSANLAERGITARFERLYWPPARGKSSLTDLIDPASVPAFHVWVQDLRMGDAVLGESRLETFPQGSGMRVDLFEARSESMQLFGRGDWSRSDERSRSSFELEFTAGELGAMLGSLGFSELIEGGQTIATLRATWPGPPAAFEIERIDGGGLEISVGQGRVPQVSPGAGRLLGLFSLTEIPRRLALDFSDFFQSGLAFNAIVGSFRFENGSAFTDDLVIDSPAAEIRVRGRTGLRDEDYDQTMEVLPRTGSVLPVVGAIAGGPAGAALGAVAQAVLQQPFRQINRTLYRVQGSWDDPQVEVIERGPAKEPAAKEERPEASPAPSDGDTSGEPSDGRPELRSNRPSSRRPH